MVVKNKEWKQFSNLKTSKRKKEVKIVGDMECKTLREFKEECKKHLDERSKHKKRKRKDRENEMLEMCNAEFPEEACEEIEQKKRVLKHGKKNIDRGMCFRHVTHNAVKGKKYGLKVLKMKT